MRPWASLAVALALMSTVLGMTWAAAPDYPGRLPAGDYDTRLDAAVPSGEYAEAYRRDALARAAVELSPDEVGVYRGAALAPIRPELRDAVPSCVYLPRNPSGTSPKFECVFHGGTVAKVKYGRNPEIHAEAVASALMTRLGYPADAVTILARLRCFGCPRYPFFTERVAAFFDRPPRESAGLFVGYTDFEWVAIERKFPAAAIETDRVEGWAWFELDERGARRPEVDGLRLAAVLLAHWDNKSENQRLVCLDEASGPTDARCARPVAMIHDLGATFGPSKLNLANWHHMPVWQDRHACTVSMRALPFGGSTFPDAQISEAGRARLAARLSAIDDAEIEQLFAAARIPEFQAGTDDESDLRAWMAAFRHRRAQIVDARCPEAARESRRESSPP